MTTQVLELFQHAHPTSLDSLRAVSTKLDEDDMVYSSSEIYLAKAWHSSPIPMWIKDVYGKMVFINDAYCAIYGIKKIDYIGKTDADIWPPEVARDFQALDQKVLDGESVEYSVEKIPNRAGFRTYDHLHVIKFPIMDGPVVKGIAGMVTGVFP